MVLFADTFNNWMEPENLACALRVLEATGHRVESTPGPDGRPLCCGRTYLATGQVVKAIPVSCKETQLSIDASQLASGSYSYSLYIDGKSVLTKKMTLSR